MKINSTKHSKKPFIVVAFVVLFAIAVIIYIYTLNGSILGWNANNSPSENNPTINLEKPTSEQIDTGNDIKKNNISKEAGSDTPPAPVEQPGSTKKNVQVIITAANQNNDTLQVRTQISTVINTGQCTIKLTKSEVTITKVSDVQSLPTTSTCRGFDIPLADISPGSWQIDLTYENDSLLGSASKIIIVQ